MGITFPDRGPAGLQCSHLPLLAILSGLDWPLQVVRSPCADGWAGVPQNAAGATLEFGAGKAVLAPGFKHGDGGRVREIQGPKGRQHWQPHAGRHMRIMLEVLG